MSILQYRNNSVNSPVYECNELKNLYNVKYGNFERRRETLYAQL